MWFVVKASPNQKFWLRQWIGDRLKKISEDFLFGEHLRLCPWSLALASSVPVLGLERFCPRKGCPWPRIFFVSLTLALASSLVSSTPPLYLCNRKPNEKQNKKLQKLNFDFNYCKLPELAECFTPLKVLHILRSQSKQKFAKIWKCCNFIDYLSSNSHLLSNKLHITVFSHIAVMLYLRYSRQLKKTAENNWTYTRND